MHHTRSTHTCTNTEKQKGVIWWSKKMKDGKNVCTQTRAVCKHIDIDANETYIHIPWSKNGGHVLSSQLHEREREAQSGVGFRMALPACSSRYLSMPGRIRLWIDLLQNLVLTVVKSNKEEAPKNPIFASEIWSGACCKNKCLRMFLSPGLHKPTTHFFVAPPAKARSNSRCRLVVSAMQRSSALLLTLLTCCIGLAHVINRGHVAVLEQVKKINLHNYSLLGLSAGCVWTRSSMIGSM